MRAGRGRVRGSEMLGIPEVVGGCHFRSCGQVGLTETVIISKPKLAEVRALVPGKSWAGEVLGKSGVVF